jgi:hypothetical protein
MILKDQGFLAYPASTNSVDLRLLAVERLLRQQILGQPALQISREGCPILVMSLGNKYRYRRRRDGALDDLPEKLHPWSDICDALQYFCLGTQSNLTGRAIRRSQNRLQTRSSPISSAAWT